MIKNYLPYILLVLGVALIVYMQWTHNNQCCGHDHNGHHQHTHEHGHTHNHKHEHGHSE